MDFQGRYQILEMLTDGEARTFKALQTSSGRTVLVHQLWVERTPPNQPNLPSLVFGFLRRATADEMKVLLDMGEESGRVFVVTEDLPVFRDLRQWLESGAGTPAAAGKAGATRSAPSIDSRATGTAGGLPSQARQESSAPPEPTALFTSPKVLQPPAAPPPPSKAKAEPGEFTRVFFGKETPGPEAAGHVSSPAEKTIAPPSSKGEGPPSQPPTGFEGAFDRRKQQLHSPKQPAVEKTMPPSPPAPGPKEGAPDSFTRMFYGAQESKAMPPSPAPAGETTRQTHPRPGQASQPEGPGEFTRLFRGPQMQEKPPAAPSVEAKPSQPSAPPVRPPEQASPGEFTQLFHGSPGTTRPTGSPLAPSSPRPTVPLSSSPTQQSPGELTQLMQGYQIGKSAERPALFEQPGPVVPPPPTKVQETGPGAFTQIFRRPSDLATPPPAPPAVQTPPPAPQAPEPDEYMRMFELPSGGAGASPQGAPQPPPPAAAPPSAGRAMPAIPGVYVAPPVAPSMPYVQPPVVSPPVVSQPQPFQMASPQFQPPAVQAPYVVAPQPVMPQMPQMQPLTVPVPAPPQATAPQAGKGKFLVPLLILGGLFVVAVVVILFFALKH